MLIVYKNELLYTYNLKYTLQAIKIKRQKYRVTKGLLTVSYRRSPTTHSKGNVFGHIPH